MNKRILLINGFKRTKILAASLIKKGYKVTAINNNKEHCKLLSEIDKLSVFHGDGSRPFVLEDANAYNADIAIALSEYDEDNLVICELCKKKFNVRKTVSTITDPKKMDFFHRMGIDSVVCTITTIANIIEQHAFLDEITTSISSGEYENLKTTQISISHNEPCVNKKLRELNLPESSIIGCILRANKAMVPRGEMRILAGDILVLITLDEHETAAIKELTGR
ncbi:MAG: NAD-binding protein [Oscillospiraceae bacterium]|nr:NAD-binding protein [Oscillospiraceae bacterium]